MKYTEKVIESLLAKADKGTGDEALKYTQAALNAANTLVKLEEYIYLVQQTD